MQSHRYDFTLRQLAAALLPTLAVLAGLAVLLKTSAASGWLPPAPGTLNPDRVVLAHQAAAAHSSRPAQIVLLGDSTCLMGVDAAALERELPGHPPVLSLALYIWLGLDVYGEALADYATANPGQVRAVVLLVSPTKLIHPPETHSALRLWQEVESKQPCPDTPGEVPALAELLGARLVRERCFSRILDTPLQGGGARYFGFVSRIDRYLTAHQGSLVEFGVLHFQPQTPQEAWKLAPALESETRALRAEVPRGAKLFVGLTPGPRLPGATPDQRRSFALLQQWNGWLHADALLTNLPPALPQVCFSPSGHLNELGQARLTAALARELVPLLRP